jgi:hypothetical protein
MPYRAPDAPHPSESRSLTGPDELSVSKLWIVVACAVFLAGNCARGGTVLDGATLVALALAWLVLDTATRRFEFSTDGDEIVLRSKLFGALTVRTRRFSIDSRLGFDSGGDDFEFPGFTVFASAREGAPFEHTFGSARDVERCTALLAAMNALIDDARVQYAALDTDRELDPALGDLHAVWSAVDPSSVQRNRWGRVREARTSRAVPHGTLGTIPAESTLLFSEDDEYRARRVKDVLRGVVLSAPSDQLYALMCLEGPPQPSRPGCTVRFSGERIECEGAFDRATLGGRAIDGLATIVTLGDRVAACTLAERLVVRGIVFEPGAKVDAFGERELYFTAVNAIEHDGRRHEPPAHVHFSRVKSDRAPPLSEVLREPGRWLSDATRVHTSSAKG